MASGNRAAVVTGASSGLGRATARKLAAAGFVLLLVGRDPRALEEVGAEIAEAGRRASHVAVDGTTAGAPATIVGAALKAFGHIDALVCAAGIIASGSVTDTTDDGWDQMLDLNVRAPFRLIRQAADALAARKGAVVNVSSVAGL